MLDNQYPLTVADLIADGELVSLRKYWSKRSREEKKEKVAELLKVTGLSGAGNLPLREASGGQLQRALIARALIKNPDFILLDEPFSNLDSTGKTIILEIISKLWETKKTSFFLIDHLGVLPFANVKKYRIENGGINQVE
jgi:ABC-type Mn2+/Zn2+ transport system ATPase subunit